MKQFRWHITLSSSTWVRCAARGQGRLSRRVFMTSSSGKVWRKPSRESSEIHLIWKLNQDLRSAATFWKQDLLTAYAMLFVPTLSEKKITSLYIFISMSFELYSYSCIAGWDDEIHWSQLVLLRVCNELVEREHVALNSNHMHQF